MNARLGSALTFCVALALPAMAAPQGRSTAPQGRITYCCTDDNGKQTCSDVLPQQCYGKAYREIDSRGITVRRVDAPLNAEQRAAKEAADKKAKEEEQKRLEQDRKNRALLATYTTEEDIDRARDRAVADIENSIRGMQEKQAELVKRKEQLDGEAEFYKKKALPPQLQSQVRVNEAEMKSQQAAIDGRKKEIELVKVRYAEEKARYRELTQKKSTDRGAAAPSAGSDARPR